MTSETDGTASPPDAPELAAGLAAFRQGRFFGAHEEWEAVWMRASGEPRRLLQALIQVAAAFVHVDAGRSGPAVRLLAAASAKLDGLSSPLLGLDPGALLRRVVAFAVALERGQARSVPAVPELGYSPPPGDPAR